MQNIKNRRLVIHSYGEEIESLVRLETEKANYLNPQEVLIRNKYVGINAVYDREMYRGKVPYLNLELPFTFGVESVGEIIAVGSNAKTIRIGDNVSLNKVGSAYQEYISADESNLVKIPEANKEYLTLNPTGVSAWLALEMLGEAKANDTVVISAAAGGLGHILVQLCKMKGCKVTAICGSEKKKEFLSSLDCCERIINYRKEDLNSVLSHDYKDKIDLAFDSVGRHLFDSLLSNMAPKGRLVMIGLAAELMNPSFEQVTRPRCYEKMYWKGVSIRCFMNHLYKSHHPEARESLFKLYQSGELKVCPDTTEFNGVESIVEASKYLLSGMSCGKVCVSMKP